MLSQLGDFLREYGKHVFWHWDAKLGYLGAGLAGTAFTLSSVARERIGDLAVSGVTVSALGLTFALASMSLLSAIVDREMVEVLDGLDRRHGSPAFGLPGLLVAFRSVAVIAAVAVASWLGARAVAVDLLTGNGWDAAQVILGTLAVGATVWLLGALVGLVHTVSVLISGKAQLLRRRGPSDTTSLPTDRSA